MRPIIISFLIKKKSLFVTSHVVTGCFVLGVHFNLYKILAIKYDTKSEPLETA